MPAPARWGQAWSHGHGAITRARCVALGGLLSVLAAVVIIVATTGRGASKPPLPPVAAKVTAHPRYWIVAPKQTLSLIAARERVSLRELERLNPRLVPSSLPTGARVRLPG